MPVRSVVREPIELHQVEIPGPEGTQDLPEAQRDWGLIWGFVVALLAVVAAGSAGGIRLLDLLQPTGLLMVLGGTFGATLVTTPGAALSLAMRRLRQLGRVRPVDRAALMEQLLEYARLGRKKGILNLEHSIAAINNRQLRETLMLVLDGHTREELAMTLELQLRLVERQSEADAKVFENAGGFAPTIGVMGTVLGLLEVMRSFSNLHAVGSGIGTAFVSTLYGLGLANLVLLPVANRIRANAADTFELGEMLMEGILGLADGLPQRILRDRLQNYVR